MVYTKSYMTSYKVIQDVEAEDKLIGPLTFRQFIYAGIAVLLGYLCYLLLTHHAGFMVIVFLPIALASAFFAWPWGRDQPTEIWALAKIRFFFLPRRRIWDQSGTKELVTITAPKRIEENFTNGLSQVEVKSRLSVLANTLDSRGWAIKSVNSGTYASPTIVSLDQDSDRLISLSSMPKPVPTMAETNQADVMDTKDSPIAKQFDTMIEASTKAHRQKIIDNLQGPEGQSKASSAPQSSAQSAWFLTQPDQPSFNAPKDAVTFNAQLIEPGRPSSTTQVNTPDPTIDEEELLNKLKRDEYTPVDEYSHLHTIIPLSEQPEVKPPAISTPPVTDNRNAVILDLASNNDLNVATIQREAQKRRATPQDEVVISLH